MSAAEALEERKRIRDAIAIERFIVGQVEGYFFDFDMATFASVVLEVEG